MRNVVLPALPPLHLPSSEPASPLARRPGSPATPPSRSPLSGLRQDPRLQEEDSIGGLTRRNAMRRGPALQVRTDHSAAPPKGIPLHTLSQRPETASPHYERRDMPTDRATLDQVSSDARLAAFAYHRDPAQLPEGWATATGLAATLRQELGFKSGRVEGAPGALVDPGSGLTAVLLRNDKTREVVLSFGGTTSGRKTGATLAERSKPGANFMTTMSQWWANVKAGVGATPKSYRQAATLLQHVQRHLNSDTAPSGSPLAGYALRAVGHSKGGGEAIYAALKPLEPLQVTTFCPAHLSDGLLKDLPADNLDRALSLVSSYSPYGDPVAGMRGKLPGLHGVGTGYHFDGIPGKSAMDLHDQFHKHVMYHCDPARPRGAA